MPLTVLMLAVGCVSSASECAGGASDCWWYLLTVLVVSVNAGDDLVLSVGRRSRRPGTVTRCCRCLVSPLPSWYRPSTPARSTCTARSVREFLSLHCQISLESFQLSLKSVHRVLSIHFKVAGCRRCRKRSVYVVTFQPVLQSQPGE